MINMTSHIILIIIFMALFEGIKKDPTSANIGWMRNKKPTHCALGYKLAAEKLSENYGNLTVSEKESLIFPIIFLYRQYIELSLKSIIRDLNFLLGNQDSDKKVLGDHKLLDLWDCANQRYQELLKNNNEILDFVNGKDTKTGRCIINEFHDLDKQSFVFRYTQDKSGEDYLSDIQYISLNNFTDQISLVIKLIERMEETIAHHKQNLSDFKSC